MMQTEDILPVIALQDDIEAQDVHIPPQCKQFKGCIAQNRTLVQKGEAFAYMNLNDEICFGRFCTSVQFSHEEQPANWVLLTPYTPLRAADGDVLYGKFRSPILEETEGKALVRANAVLEKVNMVHNCDHRCAFTITDHHCAEEREMVTTERCVFQHDMANKTYLINRFYLGETWKYIPDMAHD
ncbi:Hypothetical predicted protein [Paramuricea clavata]|uniref:Uncharacterized protein n=1 Tax=Paramuricea clavata TaxID=317549 RepID=A0A7D9ETK1_PARCT|nr:Hypothetical predicted protein [Paramuricea clavata]